MEEQSYVLKYRKKHPRCRYCKFFKYINTPIGIESYPKCVLKDKVLFDFNLLLFLYDLQGCFCKWFKPKEDDIDIQNI